MVIRSIAREKSNPMILICYGTRPEWIKLEPVIEKLKNQIPFKVLYTGQHEDIANFYHDYSLLISRNDDRLNNITSAILDLSLDIIPTYVLVQGDTATTYAMSLWAYNKGIKIIHLEAGLRTYDLNNPFPEEAYRQMISRISDINLCVTSDNRNNLINEKCNGECHIVGNTVLDHLLNIETKYEDEIIITLHRRENQPIINEWFGEINELAKENPGLKFTLPLHPSPHIQSHKHLLTHVNVIPPLSHKSMIQKIAKCKFIISDSGGIQEEASFLNKKVIVCRKQTERQESLGVHSFLCNSPKLLKDYFDKISNNYKVHSPCPYGDGRASDKILKLLKNKHEKNNS